MAGSADDLVEIRVAVPDRDTALRLARLLVDEGLAACVQVVPGVTSVYLWDGAVHEDPEQLLLIKSTTGRFAPIRDRISAEHPYDTPEVMAVPVSVAETRYASWVREAVRQGGPAGPATTDEDAR